MRKLFAVICVVLVTLTVCPICQAGGKPLPGQIIIDPEHPQWLKRHGGKHLFICGPGDPEDFLYVGKRNRDGTRDGDQVQRIRKLIEHGGNCIYMQMVRTHGGDAKNDKTQNPFIDSDPAKGLDDRILKQWEEWFTLMDRHDILIYLFFYDDSARIWNTGDVVGREEKAFVQAIVKKFKHHKNLIWIVGEESEEKYSHERVRAIAEVIKNADEHGHLIGNHHWSGTTFKAWQPGCALDHFSMQLAQTDDKAHAGAIEALKKAAGRYQIIYSESTAMKTDVAGMRRHAWAVAMGGLMPMLLRVDIANTPVETLKQCRYLQTFFEATDFYTMAPHDELKHAETKYVLARPGRSYIAYAGELTGKLGIKNLAEGKYAVTWLDCRTGRTKALDQDVPKAGDHTFDKPEEIGKECAAWIRRRASSENKPAQKEPAYYFPPPGETLANQDRRKPKEVGLKPQIIDQLKKQITTGRWALWRDGYLIHVEGDFNKVTEVKSLRKTWHALTVGAAIQQGKIPSLQQKVSVWNKELKGNHAEATWWHVITMTTGFEYPYGKHPAYRPGEIWTYSDASALNVCRGLARVYGKKDYTDDYDSVMRQAYFDAIGLAGWKSSIREDGNRFHFDLEDMGRLGLLVLARGRWNGKQLIPQDFVEALETRQTRGIKANYDGPGDGAVGGGWLRAYKEKSLEAPYGYMTWVNTDGGMFPGADRAWAHASGAGGACVLWNHKNGIVFAGLGVDTRRGTGGIALDIESCLVGPNPLLAK